MDANSLRRLSWLWKHRHTHSDGDGDELEHRVTVIEARVDTTASTGAHLHLLGGSQTVDDEAVEWSSLFATPLAFPIPSFPTTEVTVQEPGYYPIFVHLAFTDWYGGGDVWVTRTRGGVTSQVWPPPGVTSLWTSPGGSSFTGLVPALEWEFGDVIQVWFDGGEEVTLLEAVVVPWLADRSLGKLATSQPTDIAFTTFRKDTSNEVTFDLPSVESGDLLVVIASHNEQDVTHSGWTLLDSDTQGAQGASVWWKVSDGTETTSTMTLTNSIICGVACRFRVSGMNWVSNPPEVELDTSTSSPFTFPTITPALGANNYYVLPFLTTRNFSVPTSTPDDYPELASVQQDIRSLWVGSAVVAVATSVSPGAATATASSNPRAVFGTLLVRSS